MQPPPLPPPGPPGQPAPYFRDQLCPNCRQVVFRGVSVCPNCGYVFKRQPTGWDILAIVLFVLVGVPSALLAACCVLISGGNANALLMAAVFGGVFSLLLWLAFLRKKR